MYQNYELDALSQNDISAVFQFGRQLTGRLMRCIFYFTVSVTSTPSCGRFTCWRDLRPDLRGAQAYGVERG